MVGSRSCGSISATAARDLCRISPAQLRLSWDVSNAAYVIVSPQAGAVRGTRVVVQPGQTTTYKLYATNQYGRTTAAVTVRKM